MEQIGRIGIREIWPWRREGSVGTFVITCDASASKMMMRCHLVNSESTLYDDKMHHRSCGHAGSDGLGSQGARDYPGRNGTAERDLFPTGRETGVHRRSGGRTESAEQGQQGEVHSGVHARLSKGDRGRFSPLG